MAMLLLTGKDRELPNQEMGGQGHSTQMSTLCRGSTAPESGRLKPRLPGPTLVYRETRSDRLLEKVRHEKLMEIRVQFRELQERQEFALKVRAERHQSSRSNKTDAPRTCARDRRPPRGTTRRAVRLQDAATRPACRCASCSQVPLCV